MQFYHLYCTSQQFLTGKPLAYSSYQEFYLAALGGAVISREGKTGAVVPGGVKSG
jgi:hypothetical protein